MIELMDRLRIPFNEVVVYSESELEVADET